MITPMKQKIEGEKLTQIQLEILKEMSNWWEYCYGYWKFDIVIDDMAVLRPRLKKEMKGLIDLGLVECVHGLMDDDGMTCGSGFAIKYDKKEVIKDLLKNL